MTTPFESWARENRLPIDANLVSTFDSGRISGAHEAWLGAIERCARECDDLERLALEDMALEDDGRFGVYAKKYRLAARRIRALANKEAS